MVSFHSGWHVSPAVWSEAISVSSSLMAFGEAIGLETAREIPLPTHGSENDIRCKVT